jgi:hypothetical protein
MDFTTSILRRADRVGFAQVEDAAGLAEAAGGVLGHGDEKLRDPLPSGAETIDVDLLSGMGVE